MFERKLLALEFYSDNLDYQDEKTFRNFVSWIENQKIRLYKVEEREGLDQTERDDWPVFYEKYLNDLLIENLNVKSSRETQIEKLLSHAIRLEYSDNTEKYKQSISKVENLDTKKVQENENPLEKIDFNSDEFKDGLLKLQKILNIQSKANDHLSVLKAVSKLISQKLNSSAIQIAKNSTDLKDKQKSNPIKIEIDNIDLGFDTQNKILNNAAKVLRLLHIRELRELQTKINETIVSIQNITANPKTDSSLGKVGR